MLLCFGHFKWMLPRRSFECTCISHNFVNDFNIIIVQRQRNHESTAFSSGGKRVCVCVGGGVQKKKEKWGHAGGHSKQIWSVSLSAYLKKISTFKMVSPSQKQCECALLKKTRTDCFRKQEK